ncbi:hypothetical protein H9P43_009702 [Blastocladiella emersonii ATCC 22665]|nr:hypothetical protein H9P43_009702 [Blastocladiella emersonii ATCC 22665]
MAIANAAAATANASMITIRLGAIYPYGTTDELARWEYLSTRDSHALGIRHALADGFLPGANVTVEEIDTTGSGRNEDGSAVFAALEALNRNVSGILGGGTSDASKQICLVTRSFNVPSCSFISGSSQLSDKNDYPWFFRPLPTSAAIAHSVVEFLIKYNWMRIAIVREGGNAYVDSLAAEVQRFGELRNVTFLSNSLLYDAAQEDALARLYTQLVASDTRVLALIAHTDLAAYVLLYLHRRGFFTAVPRGLPRTVLFINSFYSSVVAMDPAAAAEILDAGAVVRPNLYTPNRAAIFAAFKAQYERDSGKSYPYPDVENFGEGYACAYAMVAGMHRLLAARNGTLEELASRDPKVYAGMAIKYFNVSHDMVPTPRLEFLLDDVGDGVPEFLTLSQLRYNRTASGSLEVNEVFVDTIPSPPPASADLNMQTVAFPGLRVGAIPPDATPKTPLNVKWQSTAGISLGVLGCALFLATLASLVATIYFRNHPTVKRSSLFLLIVLHLAQTVAIVAALAYIGDPHESHCVTRTIALSWSPALLATALAVRALLVYRAVAAKKHEATQRALRHTPKNARGKSSSGTVAAAVGSTIAKRFRSQSTVASTQLARLGSKVGAAIPRGASRTSVQSRFDALVAALDGSEPWRMARMLAGRAAIPLLVHAGASVYYLAACKPVVRSVVVDFLLDRQCSCASPDVLFGVYVAEAIPLAIAVAICVYCTWHARHVLFNVSETRRSMLAVSNATVFVLLILAFSVNSSVSLVYVLFVLLILFGGTSTLAIYMGPLYLRIYQSRAAAAAAAGGGNTGHIRRAASDDLLTRLPAQAEAAAKEGGDRMANISNMPSGVIQDTKTLSHTGAPLTGPRSALTAVPESSVPDHRDAVAVVPLQSSASEAADEPAAGRLVSDSASRVFSSTTAAAAMAQHDLGDTGRVVTFTVRVRRRLPFAPLPRAEAGWLDAANQWVQTRAPKWSAGLGAALDAWFKVDLWCVVAAATHAGAGEDDEAECFSLGGPLSAFEVFPVDPKLVSRRTTSGSGSHGAALPLATAEAPKYATQRRCSPADPEPPPPAPAPTDTSPYLVLHGKASRTWLTVQFASPEQRRQFEAVFPPPKRKKSEGSGGGQAVQQQQQQRQRAEFESFF